MKKSLHLRFIYAARNFRARALFSALREHAHGKVLDVGGWDFFLTARRAGVPFDSWVSLDNEPARQPSPELVGDERFRIVHGDGCAMGFPDASFDTVLCVQVLEHVFEPIRMVEEIARVLRPGGKAIFLVPQTSTTHLAPNYFQNVSRYWISSAMERANLEVLDFRPIGGFWSSNASRLVHFFVHAFRLPGMTDESIRRPLLFYPLFPLMAIWAVVSVPVCMLLSLGDLEEEPNNHLVVAAKRAGQPRSQASNSPSVER